MKIDYAKKVHRNDPITSFEAAEDVHKFAGNQEEVIFHTLLKHGPMTSMEISLNCELEYHQVARRMKDMKTRGTVEKTNVIRIVKKKRGVVWRVRD